jgi:hypothetical protein
VNIDLQRASAFAAFIIVVSGYAFIFRPLETTAGDLYAQIDAARTEFDRSTAMGRRLPALESERTALTAQLSRLHTGDRQAASVDRFLRTVAIVASQDGVAVEGVAAGIGPAPVPSPSASTVPAIEQIPFDLTLRGPYGDVIHAVRDLNDRDGAVHIGAKRRSCRNMTFASDKRFWFGAAALLCYAAAIVLAPTGARSQLDSRTRVPEVAETHVEPAPPPIAPERDAFAPRASVEDDPRPPALAPPPQLPRLPAPKVPAIAPAAVPSHLTAIVTGTHPTAIVDSAEGSRLVGIGDALDGSTVLEITSDAVGLANGKQLTLDPAAIP